MMKKANNKGFTLVEMLIVLGISAIIMSVVLISFNVINNANVQKSARRLENVIRLSRTRCMAKGNKKGELKLYEQNGNIYAQIGDDNTPQIICNSGVTMEALATTAYSVREGGSSIPPYPGISLRFNTSGTVQNYSETVPFNKFLLHKGSRNFEVIVYIETGNVEVNMY